MIANVDLVDMEGKARQLLPDRDQDENIQQELITIDRGDGDCDIQSPFNDGLTLPENVTKTLLVSYPGSGKRFT